MTPEQETNRLRDTLRKVGGILDNYIGDVDPADTDSISVALDRWTYIDGWLVRQARKIEKARRDLDQQVAPLSDPVDVP
jgi:hypothetical protein